MGVCVGIMIRIERCMYNMPEGLVPVVVIIMSSDHDL